MKRAILILFLAAMFGCKNAATGSRRNLDTTAINELADRMDRAMMIRKQRFALANAIRFTQDTLGASKSAADRARLQNRLNTYLKQKQALFSESITLADTIHRQMDSLVPYTDKTKEQAFNDLLNKTLAKKGYPAGS